MKRLGCALIALVLTAGCASVEKIASDFKTIHDKQIQATDAAAAKVLAAKTADEAVSAIKALKPAITVYGDEMKVWFDKRKAVSFAREQEAKLTEELAAVIKSNIESEQRLSDAIKTVMANPEISDESVKIMDAYREWMGLLKQADPRPQR